MTMTMNEIPSCLNLDHIDVPEDAVAIIYMRDRGPRQTYAAVAIKYQPEFPSFTTADWNAYRDEMMLAFEQDKHMACRRCGAEFEAHAHEDVSALEQYRAHAKAEHSLDKVEAPA